MELNSLEFRPYVRWPVLEMQKHLITIAVTLAGLIIWEKIVKPRL